ncbi:hypothetical protein K7472_08125 [Streptomyces sp. PTM05]|uniref:Uncharacterized protein n=1 Tax=Streptantibioticus parmotrematis TaxID=2873249 RepID=A0ABS7QNQ2_9ACTN|nr:hypothetical protein [Streptantibioticus parmotrematis]MBY8884812.1 hypothetical protein [Streptantibioticus parmotrematis]
MSTMLTHLAEMGRRRQQLAAERRQAEKAHALAVLDHLAAYVRDTCPQAAYVAFAYHGSTRTLDLQGVLGAQPAPLSALPWLWDTNDAEHPLAMCGEALEQDLQTALEPCYSPAWATVSVNKASDGNSWLLELPPPDRHARVSELVRHHHPAATAVVVDGRSAGGRVIEVIEPAADSGETRAKPRWSPECDETVARLVAQMTVLPALREQHLRPVGADYAHPHGVSTSDLIRVMPLRPAQ